MTYKVVILAAGIGSRMGGFTQSLNKALLPLKGKPVICHIIEKFPEDIEIVIATGYLKESLMTYLKTAYPQRKLTFVDVDKYTGPGTGPGYSLLQCKNHLQCPFIFLSVDTLVTEPIPAPNTNWFGVAEVNDTTRFCSVKINQETMEILQVDDKVRVEGNLAFIGLAGVYDYRYFWENLASNKDSIAGEIQVSNGFKSLLKKDMRAKAFTWFDTGDANAYAYATNHYQHGKGYTGQ